MGSWTKLVELAPIPFDGDVVRCTVSRILAEDMNIILREYARQAPAPGEGENVVVSVDVAAAISSVKKYLVNFSGYKKPDGADMQLEEFKEVCGEYFFAPLVTSIYAGLIGASTVAPDAAKNSLPPPPEPSGAVGG